MAHLLTDHAAKHGRHRVQAGARGQRQLAQHALIQLSLQQKEGVGWVGGWSGEGGQHSERPAGEKDEVRLPDGAQESVPGADVRPFPQRMEAGFMQCIHANMWNVHKENEQAPCRRSRR